MSKIALVAKLTCKEGSRDAAVEILSKQVAALECEVGTEVYSLNVDKGDEVTIWFFELYTDKEALVAHGSSEVMKANGPLLAPLLDGRPEITRLTPIVAKGLTL